MLVQDAEALKVQQATFYGLLALSAYGPCGRPKVLQANASSAAGVISSTSCRLLSGLHPSDLVSKLLVQSTVEPQWRTHGDGGLLCLHVACTLLAHGLQSSTHGAARLAVAQAYQRCFKVVAAALGQQAERDVKRRARKPPRSCQSKHCCGVGGSGSSCSSSSSSSCTYSCASCSDTEGSDNEGSSNVRTDDWAGGSCAASTSSSDTGKRKVSSSTTITSSSSDESRSSAWPQSTAQQASLTDSGEEWGGTSRARKCRRRPVRAAWMPPCFSLLGAGVDAYIALVRSVLGSKQVCGLPPANVDRACVLLVQAFLAAMPRASPQAASPEAAPSSVRLLLIPGLQPTAWDVIDGLVLDASCLKPAVSLHLPIVEPSCVALFGVSLAPGALATLQQPQHIHAGGMQGPQAFGADSVIEADAGHEWSPAAAEVEVLRELMRHLSSLGVKVVACQKLINEEVQHAALQLGMLPLQRLSAQHAASLCSVTGALPINSWQPPATGGGSWKGMLGVAGRLDTQVIANRVHLSIRSVLVPGEPAPTPSTWPAQVSPSAQAPGALGRLSKQAAGGSGGGTAGQVQTLLMGAATEAGCDELRAAAEGALRVLAWTLRVPWVLPGGGAWQAVLAGRLRAKARALRRRRKRSSVRVNAYLAMADAMERAATSLIPHTAGQAFEVLEGVRASARHAGRQLAAAHRSHLEQHAWHQHAHECSQQQRHQQLASDPTCPASGADLAQAPCAPTSGGRSPGSPSPRFAARVEWLGWLHAHAQLVPMAAVMLEEGPDVGVHGPRPARRAHGQRCVCGLEQAVPSSVHRSIRGAANGRRNGGSCAEELASGRAGGPGVLNPPAAAMPVPRCHTSLVSAALLDSLPAVMGALVAGVEAACMLLRVDTVVAEK